MNANQGGGGGVLLTVVFVLLVTLMKRVVEFCMLKIFTCTASTWIMSTGINNHNVSNT